MARQLIRLRDVRAPDAPNADALSQAQVRSTAGAAEDMETYNSAVISQIRLAQGSQAWTQPPSPSAQSVVDGGSTNANGYASSAGQLIVGEALSGDQNGTNLQFALSHFAIPQTVIVFYNGLPLLAGQSMDYVVAEAVTGQGFGLINLTGAVPPRSADRLWANYTRSA